MRKFFIAAAVATSALAAAPAAAQYYPAPQPAPYGYGQPQGYGYGYNYGNQRGLVRSYLVRVDQLRNRVERLDSRNRISDREAARLRNETAQLQQRVRSYAYDGLNWRERQDLDRRIAWVERTIRSERYDGDDRRWRDRDGDGQWDRRDEWIDRDRDGRDDRYEDDRGRYPG